jgi:hypothetical protein
VRDLFNAVAESARKLANVIVEAFPKAQTAGANFADSFTIAWSGVVGILSAVVAGTLKVVEAIGQATFEVGKYFDRYSAEEIGKIQANLDGLSVSAGEFAAVAARSFDASGAAIDRMRERSEQAATGQATLNIAVKDAAKSADDLAGSADRQAKAQEALVGQSTALAFALQKQKAEVEALSKADLSSEEAKNKHAAATQKLWDLQTLFGEAIKGLTSEQFANVVANEQVQQSLAQLGTVVEAGGVVLGQYVGTVQAAPQSLDQLRVTMETTRAEMQRVEEAYKNGTLKATENKSVIGQLNEAHKHAADGIDVYNAALERNIVAEEDSAKTAGQKRQAIEALTQSQTALIDASIRLAEIAGDEAKIAALVAEKKAEQLASSQALAEQYAKEATAAQGVADALRLKYDNLVKTNPLDTEAIRQAKEAADAAQAEAYAKKAVEIETAALIPVLKAEADAAARAAGPIGELIRLYEQKATAADQETSAIQRSYADKQRDLDVDIAQAQAKGDSALASELKAQKTQLEAEAAQALADAITRQMAVEIDALEIKKLDILASDQAIEAKNKEIAAIDELIAKKREQANIAQDTADSAQAAADAENNAAEQLVRLGNTVDSATQSMNDLNVAAVKLGGTWITGFGFEGVERFNAAIATLNRQIETANTTSQQLADEGLGSLGAASASSIAYLQDLIWSLSTSESYLNSAAHAAADNLAQALAQARKEAEGMTASIAGMAEDFRREILQMQGDQKALLDLEHQDNLKKLEELHQRAGAISNDEYQTAVKQANDLHALKIQQLNDEEASTAQVSQATATATKKAGELGSALQQSSSFLKDMGKSMDNIAAKSDTIKENFATINSLGSLNLKLNVSTVGDTTETAPANILFLNALETSKRSAA